MEEELTRLIKIWISAVISISYCYYIPPRIKSGVPRLRSLCPVLALFLVLPLCFSSVHLSLITAFFLTWLANFKLILFSFDKGPLIPLPPSLSRFICFTCFPIKAQQNPKSQNHMPKLVFAIKVAIFDNGDTAVAAESGCVEAAHCRVRDCDGWVVIYTSAYKERRDREIHQ
ncbi:hypothetical protein F2Q69_00039280 [Brassica cretica]|uniref:Uncharacterized protein n=1 Tax=Brassica cretica TaxID=69181 RepID=A0A8S9SEM8_BRACR|nr:hypothetical protein F2Q69_00039280 [Brassica cretica]